MSREQWLAGHPYLRPLADFSAQVDRTAAELAVPAAVAPDWEAYRADYAGGVPLLASGAAAIDLAPGGRMAAALVERLMPVASPDRLASELRALGTYLQYAPDPPGRIVDFILGDETITPPFPGLLRYLAWTALARYLNPIAIAFDRWRDDDQWLRRYCPSCGSRPAMAQLVGVDHGRKRLLACGCCGMRWQFTRTACPFCETDSQSLATVKIGGEAALRIDHCSSCCGYLKTYEGEGEEALLLADWSSLHVDLVAHERGLKRLAGSLYEFEPRESDQTIASHT